MVQLFSAVCFSLAATAVFALLAAMLHGEWARVLTILSGRELAGARAVNPKVRVRMRAWKAPQPRRALPLRAAA